MNKEFLIKYKNILIPIVLFIVIFLGMLNDRYLGIKIIDYFIRIIGVLLVLYIVVGSFRRGTSTGTLKKVLRETSEKTGLKLSRPKGMDRLVAPLTVSLVLEGDYKNCRFLIRLIPSAGGRGPFGDTAWDLIVWGHFDLVIEMGPFKINNNHPTIKKGGLGPFIDLPLETRQMPYDFTPISIINEKLVLYIKNKCPKNSEDLIKIIDSLINVAREISL